MLSVDEINKLKAQNEALKKQCSSLQQEVKNLKHEHEKAIWRKCQCLKEQQDEIFHLKNKLADAKRALQDIKAIVSGDYEMLDPQAVQEIRSILTKAEEECTIDLT